MALVYESEFPTPFDAVTIGLQLDQQALFVNRFKQPRSPRFVNAHTAADDGSRQVFVTGSVFEHVEHRSQMPRRAKKSRHSRNSASCV
jgi:hypothetical protein